MDLIIDDTSEFSIDAMWSEALNELRGGNWDDEAFENIATIYGKSVADTLKVAYDEVDDVGDGVAAVLFAAEELYDGPTLQPVQIAEVATGYATTYTDMDEVVQHYLDDFTDGFQPEWLNGTGRDEVISRMKRENEIWVDVDFISGVWVFEKPDDRR